MKIVLLVAMLGTVHAASLRPPLLASSRARVLAQAAAAPRTQRGSRSGAPAEGAGISGSLQGHLALAVAERLLASGNSDDRIRAIERLAAFGQREGVDRLVRALETASPAWRDLRARITALRALVPYAAKENVRQVLSKGLSTEPGRFPLALLAQQTAAMALAASEDARALDVLVSAVRQGGTAGDAAERALLAYPPRSIVAFGPSHDGIPAPVGQLLGRLQDVRAIGLLRGTLARGFSASRGGDTPESGDASNEEQSKKARMAAALALSALGDEEQLPVARSWVAGDDPEFKLTGARVLAQSGAKDAGRAVAALLSSPELRAPALRLAVSMDDPALLGPLTEAAEGADEGARMALGALAHFPTSNAIAKLGSLARDPAHAWNAAFALARAPGARARQELEAMLAEPRHRRLAVRAGVVRELVIADGPSGLSAALRALLEASEPADRAVGAFGSVALGQADVEKLLRSDDGVVVRAVARTALIGSANTRRLCVERLAGEKDPLNRAALALALAVAPESRSILSTEQLSAWAESGQPWAPLSALALGERETDPVESFVRRLLLHADPLLRAHAALGLGRSPLSDAAARLAEALRFEGNDVVRAAIVMALAERREPQRMPALEQTARLDPEMRVRELARLALRDRLPRALDQAGAACRGEGSGACRVAWISLVPSDPSAAPLVQSRPGRWVDASGLCLPVVADPDGAFVLAGVSAGPASFRLASSAFWYDARTHDVVEETAR